MGFFETHRCIVERGSEMPNTSDLGETGLSAPCQCRTFSLDRLGSTANSPRCMRRRIPNDINGRHC